MVDDEFDDEFAAAKAIVDLALYDAGSKHRGRMISDGVLLISDDEELQSIIMWVCEIYKIPWKRTDKKTQFVYE